MEWANDAAYLGKLYVASEPNDTAAGLAMVTWDL